MLLLGRLRAAFERIVVGGHRRAHQRGFADKPETLEPWRLAAS